MKTLKSISLATAFILFVSAYNGAHAKIKNITIGSNKAGSVFFLLANGFSKHIQKNLGIRTNAQPHAGSSVYLPLVNNGEVTIGVNNALDIGSAVRGKPPFRKKLSNLSVLARVWIIPYGMMVKNSSGIKSIQDVRGKKFVTDVTTVVSLGRLNRLYLASAGMTTKDVIAVKSGGVVKNVNMVVEGRVDASPIGLGMPQVRKAHATVPGGIRFIGLGPKATDEFIMNYAPGAYGYVGKPAKNRPYITKPIRCLAFDTYLDVGPAVSDDLAYKITKLLHRDWKKIQKDYPPTRGVKSIVPATNSAVYHPGAVKYYKEAGIWTAANAKHQAKIAKETR